MSIPSGLGCPRLRGPFDLQAHPSRSGSLGKEAEAWVLVPETFPNDGSVSGKSWGETQGTRLNFLKLGFRFSTKAVLPSLASSLM
jgi:hypothetical protein